MRKIFFSALILLSLACSHVFCADAQPVENGSLLFHALNTQRSSIKARDEENGRTENNLALIRSDDDNALIRKNKDIMAEKAEAVLDSIPDQTEEALRSIRKIEKLKANILRFSEYYDSLSPEIQSLTEELEEEYAALSERSFTTTSLSPHVILRADSYSTERESWKSYIYTEFFGYVSLFNSIVELPYKDFFGKRNPFSGYRNVSYEERQYDNIMIADSLFRTADPAVYVVFTYRIVRWKAASEYRFIPTRCEIYRTDNNTLVAKLHKDELKSSTFIVYPQVEVRTRLQKEEEADLSAKQIAKQDKKAAPKESSKNLFPMFDKQLKRRAIFITVDTAQTSSQLSDFDLRAVKLNSIKLNLDFGLTKNIFLGGMMGYDYNGLHKEADYSFGLDLGFNTTLWGILRPYLQAELSFRTDYSLITTFGAGFDIVFGKLMLNVGYGYNWDYDINTKFKFEKAHSRDTFMHYHTFSIGAGLTW